MTSHRLLRLAGAFLLAAPCAFLDACGGGTSDAPVLQVSFFYNDSGGVMEVWRSYTMTPVIDGLDGHAPSCRVSDGRLPAGVTLDSHTCVLSGAAQETGMFPVTVTLTASGTSGSVDTQVIYSVGSLAMTYPGLIFTWGHHVGPLMPSIEGYTPQAGDTISYAFTTGLGQTMDQSAFFTLDPASGTLEGTPTGGPYHGTPVSLSINATILRDGHAVVASLDAIRDAYVPEITYPVAQVASLSDPVDVAPTAPPFAALGFTATYSFDPDISTCHGSAVIDPSTGVISGTVNNPRCAYYVRVSATKGTQTVSGATFANVDLQPF